MKTFSKDVENDLKSLAKLLNIPIKHGWKTRLSEKIGIELSIIANWINRGRIGKPSLVKIENLGYPASDWITPPVVEKGETGIPHPYDPVPPETDYLAISDLTPHEVEIIKILRQHDELVDIEITEMISVLLKQYSDLSKKLDNIQDKIGRIDALMWDYSPPDSAPERHRFWAELKQLLGYSTT